MTAVATLAWSETERRSETDDRAVLERLVKYALEEADRNGEYTCAGHLERALRALEMPSNDDVSLCHCGLLRQFAT